MYPRRGRTACWPIWGSAACRHEEIRTGVPPFCPFSSRLLSARHASRLYPLLFPSRAFSGKQIDNPDRGFTYKWEGPLDLRMNPTRGQPASALLAKWAKQGPAVLEALLVANADEEHAGRIARAICAAAGRGAPPATTTALAQVVRGALADLRCAFPVWSPLSYRGRPCSPLLPHTRLCMQRSRAQRGA